MRAANVKVNLQMIALLYTRTINLKEAAQGGEQKEKGRQCAN